MATIKGLTAEVRRLKQVVRALSRATHRNVVRVEATVRQDGGGVFIVTAPWIDERRFVEAVATYLHTIGCDLPSPETRVDVGEDAPAATPEPAR